MIKDVTFRIIHSHSRLANIARKAISFVFSLLFLPLAAVLLILTPMIRIRFVKIRDDRLGHQAANTELFLRRLRLGKYPTRRTIYIGLASTDPANEQLLKMISRQIRVVRIPAFIQRYIVALLFFKTSVLVMTRVFINLQNILKSNEWHEFNDVPSQLSWTKEEEKKGRRLKEDMGVGKDGWFICIHARDSAYLKKKYTINPFEGADAYRNCDINTYLKACDYIVKKGGSAVRMGSVVGKPLRRRSGVIDYANNHRSDFGDVYLASHCKFFLGSSCGINQISMIFSRPIAVANVIPVIYPPFRKTDLFIPKKIFSVRKKRFLTVREIMDGKAYLFNDEYEKDGLRIVENTPEEILELCMEMDSRIDCTWKTTEEDERLQARFKALFKNHPQSHDFPSRIGAKFIKDNRFLLD